MGMCALQPALFNQELFREVLHDVRQSHLPVCGDSKNASKVNYNNELLRV